MTTRFLRPGWPEIVIAFRISELLPDSEALTFGASPGELPDASCADEPIATMTIAPAASAHVAPLSIPAFDRCGDGREELLGAVECRPAGVARLAPQTEQAVGNLDPDSPAVDIHELAPGRRRLRALRRRKQDRGPGRLPLPSDDDPRLPEPGQRAPHHDLRQPRDRRGRERAVIARRILERQPALSREIQSPPLPRLMRDEARRQPAPGVVLRRRQLGRERLRLAPRAAYVAQPLGQQTRRTAELVELVLGAQESVPSDDQGPEPHAPLEQPIVGVLSQELRDRLLDDLGDQIGRRLRIRPRAPRLVADE